jgi:hypothetical protein
MPKAGNTTGKVMSFLLHINCKSHFMEFMHIKHGRHCTCTAKVHFIMFIQIWMNNVKWLQSFGQEKQDSCKLPTLRDNREL